MATFNTELIAIPAVRESGRASFGSQSVAISIPLPGPALISVVAGLGTIVLTFGDTVTLTGASILASNWTITAGPTLTVTSISVLNNTITLATTAQVTGGTYSLTIPAGVSSLLARLFAGPFVKSFVGVGVKPSIVRVTVMNSHDINVIFSTAMNTSEATNPFNYSISGGVQVLSVQQLSAAGYNLVTTTQVAGSNHIITATGIHDSIGNLI